MSRRRLLCAGLAAVLVILAGCAETGTAPLSAASGSWPENAWTAQLPLPRQGELRSARTISAAGWYEIVWQGLPRAGAHAYLEELEAAGFERTAAAETGVSGGVTLEQDGAALSVSYSGEWMVLLVIPDGS